MKFVMNTIGGPVEFNKPSEVIKLIPIEILTPNISDIVEVLVFKYPGRAWFENDGMAYEEETVEKVQFPIRAIRREWSERSATIAFLRKAIKDQKVEQKVINTEEELHDVFLQELEDHIHPNCLFRMGPRTYAVLDTYQWRFYKEGMKKHTVYSADNIFMGRVEANKVVFGYLRSKGVPVIKLTKEFVKDLKERTRQYARYNKTTVL